MKALKKKGSLVLCVLFVLAALASTSAMAATPEEIEESIEDGIEWLVAQQNPDGSWVDDWGEAVSPTAFAVIKLEEYAFEHGFDSPFDLNYPYKEAVEAGLYFIFQNAHTIQISVQPAGDPDSNGNGVGVWFGDWSQTYDTGISMMAIAASRAPDRVVDAPGPVNGLTYGEVLQDAADYMAFGQTDINSPQRGGWGYYDNYGWSDNSNTGYAVLGLAYAQHPDYGFNCTIPTFVKSELELWVEYIQTDGGPDDGGSGYDSPGWANVLRTGNLIFEMTFVGDSTEPPTLRLQRALDYLGRTWNDPSQDPGWGNPAFGGTPHYQAMYCVMKGLEYSRIDTIVVDGNERDWYADFADAIVHTQQVDGSWPWDYWGGAVLATEWALLTLEKFVPPPPPQSCFGVNHLNIVTKDDEKGEVEIKGTFEPAEPIDLAVDDVEYTIDDGQGHTLSFFIPAGSFKVEGKPDKQKFKFHSAKGSEPDIRAKFDFDKCKFELKVKAVTGTGEIASTTLTIELQAGLNLGQELVEAKLRRLDYKAKPKMECCPKCKGIALMEVTSDQGMLVFEPEPGKEKLKANTLVDDGVNGPVKIHTSCSKPIDVGDVFGPYTITGLIKIFDDDR